MKVFNLTGIRKMEMVEVVAPILQNDTDILVKLSVVAVCGSDVHYYTTGRIGSQVVKYPFPVGHECSGVVVEVASGVKGIKSGDRVAIEPAMPCGKCDQCLCGRENTCRNLKFLGCPGQADGSLSEYIVMPESSCFKIPGNLTMDDAAICEPLSIGLYAVKQSLMKKGQTACILGYGPIGMSVMLAAKAYGIDNFYVSDKIDERLGMAKLEGATCTVNVQTENASETILNALPLGADVAFECCGQQEALEDAINILKPGGTIMLIGIPEFDNWKLPADLIRRKELTIVNIRRQNHCVQEAIDLLASGNIDVSRMPTHRFSFNDTQKAFDLVDNYSDGVMKAMIDFD